MSSSAKYPHSPALKLPPEYPHPPNIFNHWPQNCHPNTIIRQISSPASPRIVTQISSCATPKTATRISSSAKYPNPPALKLPPKHSHPPKLKLPSNTLDQSVSVQFGFSAPPEKQIAGCARKQNTQCTIYSSNNQIQLHVR